MAVKISRDADRMRWRTSVDPEVLLKGPHTDSLVHICSPKLQRRDSSLRRARDIWGGTELYGFRVRPEEAALSGTKVPIVVVVPLLSPPTTQPGAGRNVDECHCFFPEPSPQKSAGADRCHILVCSNLANKTVTPPYDSLRSAPLSSHI